MTHQLTHGSLFAGIGGFDLGFERAGMKTVWQVEIDPFCRKVLEKHWPNVQRFEDVRECGAANLKPIDVISGGFPCQDISVAGKGAGLDGERSGLWREYLRIIRELRPRFVVVENVSALLARGLGRILGDLAEIGYDVEWECIPASAVGAPHRRDRIWIVAYPQCGRWREPVRTDAAWQSLSTTERQEGALGVGSSGTVMAHANVEGPERRKCAIVPECAGKQSTWEGGPSVADSIFEQRNGWVYWTCGWEREPQETVRDARRGRGEKNGEPIPESLLGRVADGIPNRVDRLRSLGNAIVPQIAEWIGRRIIAAHQGE